MKSNIIPLILKAYSQNKKFIFIKSLSYNNEIVLSYLSEFGYIKNFNKNSLYYIIELNQNFNNKKPGAIICMNFLKNKKTFKHKSLQNILYQFGDSPFIVLSTDRGVVSGNEAVLKRIGGKVVTSIQ